MLIALPLFPLFLLCISGAGSGSSARPPTGSSRRRSPGGDRAVGRRAATGREDVGFEALEADTRGLRRLR